MTDRDKESNSPQQKPSQNMGQGRELSVVIDMLLEAQFG
jgi:hypothetical protein